MENCRNCGAALQGPYCSQCGQQHIAGRLTLAQLISHAFEALTELDSTVWRTVRECTLNPGRVALNYIGGQRVSYVNPVKFFLTIFAIYVGVLVMTGTLDRIAEDAVHIGPGTDMERPVVRTAVALQTVLKTHFNLIFFIALPMMAFAFRWQYWRSGRNYAETAVFLAYLVGITSLYATLFVPLYYIAESYSGVPRSAVLLTLFMIGARTFYGMGWGKTFGGLLVSLVLYSLCTAVAGILLAWAQMAGVL